MVHLIPGHAEHRRGRRGRAPDADALAPALREQAAEGRPTVDTGIRPDLIRLSEEQAAGVRRILRRRGWRCPSCGGAEADVGQALYLGFLFHSEDLDSYMIGLTCTRPGCGHPRDGIRLREGEFAPEGSGAEEGPAGG